MNRVTPLVLLEALLAAALAGCSPSAPPAATPQSGDGDASARAAAPSNAELAKAAYARKDYAAFLVHSRAEADATPTSPRAIYNLACAYARNAKIAEAGEALARLASMRVYFDITRDEDFAEILGSHEIVLARRRFEGLKVPVARSSVALTLADRDLLTEGIAYDLSSGAFFVSSVHQRKIVRIDTKGAVTDFVTTGQDGLYGVFGMRVDPRRHVLWATSAAVPEMRGYRPEDQGKGGIFELDLATGKLRRRLALDDRPGKHAPGDVAVGSRGDAFVTDAASGAVYVVAERATAVADVVPAGTFRSPQGIVLSPDERSLIVADYSRGLFRIERSTRAVTPIVGPPDLVLTGIDGLAAFGGDLVATQNGIEPHRVIRLGLDAAASTVTSSSVLEMNNPLVAEPTLGVVIGNEYFYVARSQWARFDPSPKKKLPPREEPIVLKMRLE